MPSWEWSYNYPLLEPLAPKDIAGNEALFDRHHPNIFQLRYIPIWTIRDTPLHALYRLYGRDDAECPAYYPAFVGASCRHRTL
jgi:hypothetical protein